MTLAFVQCHLSDADAYCDCVQTLLVNVNVGYVDGHDSDTIWKTDSENKLGVWNMETALDMIIYKHENKFIFLYLTLKLNIIYI